MTAERTKLMTTVGEPSDLLSRVGSFLPRMIAANEALSVPENAATAAALVRIELQAFDSDEDDDDDDSSISASIDSSSKDGASRNSSSSSSTSTSSSTSSNDEEKSSDDDVDDRETGSRKAVEEGSLEPPFKKTKRLPPINPTIVMNLQLRPLEDISELGLLTGDDDHNDEPKQQPRETPLVAESIMMNNLLYKQRGPPLKQPKGPLITEVEDEK